jgi:tartrate dehydrogenase/decarboxylase/D-malate dehydrogenase
VTKPKIAYYPGDGIGVEVLEEGRKALTAAGFDADWTDIDWNASLYPKIGACAPADFLEILKPFDAIFLGALGDPSLAPESVALNPLLEMRRRFQQFACVRPAYLFPGAVCPLAGKKPGDIDMIVIRENTEGEYADIGGRLHIGTDHEVATQVNVFTRVGVERILRFGFETARSRPKKKLTLVNKGNAQRFGNVFFEEVYEILKKEYPDVTANRQYVDAAAMNFVRCPETFDTIVTTNLFGDILTDVAAVLIGGMGYAASANLDPTRANPSMFEPVHGSAPDIAGKGIANPIAAICAGAMMADFIGQTSVGDSLRRALRSHLEAGSSNQDSDILSFVCSRQDGSGHKSDIAPELSRL